MVYLVRCFISGAYNSDFAASSGPLTYELNSFWRAGYNSSWLQVETIFPIRNNEIPIMHSKPPKISLTNLSIIKEGLYNMCNLPETPKIFLVYSGYNKLFVCQADCNSRVHST